MQNDLIKKEDIINLIKKEMDNNKKSKLLENIEKLPTYNIERVSKNIKNKLNMYVELENETESEYYKNRFHIIADTYGECLGYLNN